MGANVDDVIPAALMRADQLPAVIAFIRNLKALPSSKRQLLAKWGYIVGATVSKEDLAYVQVIDRK